MVNSDHTDNSFQASAQRCYDINTATKTGKDEVKNGHLTHLEQEHVC